MTIVGIFAEEIGMFRFKRKILQAQITRICFVISEIGNVFSVIWSLTDAYEAGFVVDLYMKITI